MYSSIITGAVHGIDSYLMRVETDISNGLPSFNMVGFMSGEMREAGERVRVALKNLGIHMPPQRITVNLSPAGIPKRGMVVDLPVSVGLLVCLGYIPDGAVNNVLVAGELGLNGEIRPVNGILSIVMEAKENGISTCIVPNGNLKEGALVHGMLWESALWPNWSITLRKLLRNGTGFFRPPKLMRSSCSGRL